MNKYVFVGRVKNDDRDCCFYVDEELHLCGDGRINIHGACFSGFNEEYLKEVQEDNVESYLSKEELIELLNGQNYDKHISKLQSSGAKEFRRQIIEEEKNWVMDEYCLIQEDVDYIFDNYYLDYKDRGIVSMVYASVRELGEELAFSFGIMSHDDPYNMNRYFDYELFGEDNLDNENYIELPSGRIVGYNY